MASHAVLIVDGNGVIEKANAAARALFGECTGRPCREVVRVRDVLCDAGCRATCAHELATGDGGTNSAVGVVAGAPYRVLCAGMGGNVVVTVLPSGDLPQAPEALTAREREVLSLVAAGLSSERIGRRLGISPATVRTHVEHVRGKLGARTRAEAVARGTALGIV